MGLAVALAPVIMLFVSFSAAFVARRLFSSDSATPSQFQKWISTPVPWNLLLLNTLVLLVSSVTIEMARRHLTKQVALAPVKTIPGVSLGHERNIPWLGFTIALGILFLLGQLHAWNQMELRGVVLSSTASSSFFYLLTGMHAVHLAGGILALLYAAFAACEAFRSGAAAHYHRRRCLVLALHGRVVDLHSHFDRDRPLVRRRFPLIVSSLRFRVMCDLQKVL